MINIFEILGKSVAVILTLAAFCFVFCIPGIGGFSSTGLLLEFADKQSKISTDAGIGLIVLGTVLHFLLMYNIWTAFT